MRRRRVAAAVAALSALAWTLSAPHAGFRSHPAPGADDDPSDAANLTLGTGTAIAQREAPREGMTRARPTDPATDFDFHYQATPKQVTVSGVLPDHRSVSTVLSALRRLHGSRFVNRLVVQPGSPQPAWLPAAVDAISRLYGHPAVALEIRDNRAVLRGTIPDSAAHTALVAAMENRFAKFGIPVEDRLDVVEVSESANLTLTKLGDHVVLAGHLPNERYVTKLVAVAQVVFPDSSVSDRLSAGDERTEPKWLDPVISLMPELRVVDRAGIKTDGHRLTLAGEVGSAADKQAFLERAQYVLGDMMPIEDRLTVVAAPPVAATPPAPAPAVAAPSTDPVPPPTTPAPEPTAAEKTAPEPDVTALTAPTAAAQHPPTGAARPPDQRLSEALAKLDFSAIHFESGSARLAPSGQEVLSTLAALLRDHAGDIEISGHTDSTGPEQYNLKLSRQRARSVENYLLVQGVEPGRMTSVGHGESRPIASNATAAGQARNRRIEITVRPAGD